MFKEQKGITLVALVITIIVLLILAGVSISLVLGNNGVLTQASGAVTATNIAKVREDVGMALSSMEMDYNAAWATNTATTRANYYNEAGFVKYLTGDVKYEALSLDTTAHSIKVTYSNVNYTVLLVSGTTGAYTVSTADGAITVSP